MKTFRILFVVLLLQIFSSNAEEIALRLTAEHDAGLAELVAQGTTLFFSALTGIDFMEWEANTTQTWTRGSNFIVIGRIPASEIKRVQESVIEYVNSGSLSEDFGKQGLEAKISFWVPSISPSSTSSPIPLESTSPSSTSSPSVTSSFVPKSTTSPSSIPKPSISSRPIPSFSTTIAKPIPNDSDSDSESDLEIEVTLSPEPEEEFVAMPTVENSKLNSGSTVAGNNEENATEIEHNKENLGNEDQEYKEQSQNSEPQIPAGVATPEAIYVSEEITEKDFMEPTSNDTAQEKDIFYPPSSSDIAERDFELGPTEKLSDFLNLTVSSPVFGFPSDLRDAFKWLISEETETNVDDWIMWDVLEKDDVTFSAYFRKIGTETENNKTISEATEFVRSGQLEKKLLDIDSAGEFKVHLQQNDSPYEQLEEDGGNFADPSMLPFPAEASPHAIPELKRGQEFFEFPLNVSSPIHGFGNDVEEELRKYAASQVNLSESSFILKSVEKEDDTAYFDVVYEVKVDETRKFNISEELIELVRNKSIDRHLSSVGYELVEVRLVPRMMNTTNEDSEKSRQRGALRPSAGTITASIVGIAVVMVIGIVVALYCLPKNKPTQLQG